MARLPQLAEHLEHGLVGAAVQGAGQGVDAGRDRVEEVRLGRTDEPHRRGRAVLLVVGVQDEEQVEGLGDRRIDLVGLGRVAERHAHEVLDERERVVGVHVRLADALLVGHRGDGGHLGQQAHGRHLDLGGVEGVETVLVEGAERRDRRAEHRHRVRVAREAVEEGAQVFVQHRVTANPLLEGRQLVSSRELAVDQQVGDLGEGRLLGQLVDGVAPIAQDAGVTVDVGDGALAGGRVDEAHVVGDQTGLLQQ